MEQLGASLRREVVQEEGRFRQVYISFYTAKANQLAQRFRQGGSEVKERWKGVGVTSQQLLKKKEEQGLSLPYKSGSISPSTPRTDEDLPGQGGQLDAERLEEEEQERCNLKEEVDDSQFIAV